MRPAREGSDARFGIIEPRIGPIRPNAARQRLRTPVAKSATVVDVRSYSPISGQISCDTLARESSQNDLNRSADSSV
jgi:hypothetical protein